MHNDEFRYRSKDNLNLYARVWTPEGDVHGVVALVHGLGEYGGRYVDIGHSFVDSGYAFVAGDLRGHGVSEGRRAFVARLDNFMDDLDQYCDEVRARFPGKPLFLYLSLIHISEPTRLGMISYAVFCLKKKKYKKTKTL